MKQSHTIRPWRVDGALWVTAAKDDGVVAFPWSEVEEIKESSDCRIMLMRRGQKMTIYVNTDLPGFLQALEDMAMIA